MCAEPYAEQRLTLSYPWTPVGLKKMNEVWSPGPLRDQEEWEWSPNSTLYATKGIVKPGIRTGARMEISIQSSLEWPGEEEKPNQGQQ